MNAVESWLSCLYASFPAWLSMAVMLLAAGSFVANYIATTRLKRSLSYPPMALAVAVSLVSISLWYLWIAAVPDVSVTARAGASRILLALLAVSLTLYNGGMIGLVVREVIKREP